MKQFDLRVKVLLTLLLTSLIRANEVDLDDGKPMKIQLDGHGKKDVDLDLDGIQFQIPIERKEPGALDFLPEDLKKEEIDEDGGLENAMEALGKRQYFCWRWTPNLQNFIH